MVFKPLSAYSSLIDITSRLNGGIDRKGYYFCSYFNTRFITDLLRLKTIFLKLFIYEKRTTNLVMGNKYTKT